MIDELTSNHSKDVVKFRKMGGPVALLWLTKRLIALNIDIKMHIDVLLTNGAIAVKVAMNSLILDVMKTRLRLKYPKDPLIFHWVGFLNNASKSISDWLIYWHVSRMM